jgi:hypothetical protein
MDTMSVILLLAFSLGTVMGTALVSRPMNRTLARKHDEFTARIWRAVRSIERSLRGAGSAAIGFVARSPQLKEGRKMHVTKVVLMIGRAATSREGLTHSANVTVYADAEAAENVEDAISSLYLRVDTMLRDALRDHVVTHPIAKPKPMPAAKRETQPIDRAERAFRGSGARLSEKQKKCLFALAREQQLNLKEFLEGAFGAENVSNLTMSEASDAIDHLRSMSASEDS